jgi:phosphopantothenoylcysteine decarboxylase/phosphopantothenate--cysteine ligase
VQMWSNAATRRNVAQLAADGVTVLGPGSGELACMEYGDGRMLEAEELHAALHAFVQPKVLQGRRVIVTAGPTFEAIDPVRGITNLSTGKMGFAIARAAAEAGATVTVVAGPTSLATPAGVRRIDVESAAQMAAAVMHGIDACDVFIAVAAVADYTVAQPAAHKIKKSDRDLALTLKPTTDILAAVAARLDGPYCVGFAAETDDVDENAEAKRKRKRVPLIIANKAQDAFGRDDNEVTLIDDAGWHRLPRMEKVQLARRLVGEIARRAGSRAVP